MDIKYVVLPEKKMVKAIAVYNGKYAEGISDQLGDLLVSRGVNPNSLKVPNNITGISKTHPDDEFDIEVGKQIARDRMLIKYNTKLAEVHELCKANLEKITKSDEWRVKICNRKIKNATQRLKDTLGN